ncbi:U6 snRNA phosphodiesterase [Megalops cyprinoides]|uniref:U6 snRNA phosphodiesterase n=1 Tax=Megalops cyprinoides TaxID=118141 RepID=UPI001865458C|nr:U6 snRNA phosphodiesterase [Megalops cyprinoides]
MLVGYSSSSEEEEEEEEEENDRRKREGKRDSCHSDEPEPVCKKHRRVPGPGDGPAPNPAPRPTPARPRLPLPDVFRVPDGPEPDDPSAHGGRVRSFPHERGNWATHVYVPYAPEEGLLDLLGEALAGRDPALTRTAEGEELHVSLSQTVPLRHHWIRRFVGSLRAGLRACRRSVCVADRLQVYTNQERTRTFLGAEVTAGHAHLLELARAVDRTMEEFDLATFYENPSFHVSLAWCVGDKEELLRSGCLQEVQALLDSHFFPLSLDCGEIRCRSGNKVFSFPLR